VEKYTVELVDTGNYSDDENCVVAKLVLVEDMDILAVDKEIVEEEDIDIQLEQDTDFAEEEEIDMDMDMKDCNQSYLNMMVCDMHMQDEDYCTLMADKQNLGADMDDLKVENTDWDSDSEDIHMSYCKDTDSPLLHTTNLQVMEIEEDLHRVLMQNLSSN
jgi:hypothetical protein